MSDYHINVFFSEEDGGYVADVPDLKSCSAFGRTPEEALREVLVAKQAWLETARAKKKPLPKPRYRPPSTRPQREPATAPARATELQNCERFTESNCERS